MNKSSVSVVLPVYNEEKNIKNILNAILSQEQENFTLKEIVIYSDNSTDKTHEIINEYKKTHSLIKLITDTNRKGKYLRLDQAFHEITTDVMVVLDADIALVGTHFIEKLVKVFMNDSQAMLIQTHQVLIRPHTFIGKIIYTNFVLWDYVRWSFPSYNSPQNFYASAIAFRGSFTKKLHVLPTFTDPHLYLYLMAAKIKGFRYCREAEIRQWPIATLKDFNTFLNRSLGKPDPHLEQLFNIKTEELYTVPFFYKLRGIFASILHEPLFTPLSFLLTLFMKIKPYHTNKNAVWDIVTSTKKPINYEN